jgi:hypothetical protein
MTPRLFETVTEVYESSRRLIAAYVNLHKHRCIQAGPYRLFATTVSQLKICDFFGRKV